jgi:deoxyribose-phosphate aldolase
LVGKNLTKDEVIEMTDTSKKLTELGIAQMVDISAVRTNSSDERVAAVVSAAKKHNCYLVTVLPAQTLLAKRLLDGGLSPKLGGNVGFPSGGKTTTIKVAEARELVRLGVNEIDMVIDVAAHLSGRYNDVLNDIKAVVDASDGLPVKVILECFYLNDTQIRKGCDLAIQACAAFVKTGSGWTLAGATLENVTLIKQHVGDQIAIKASGGVQGLDMVLKLYQRGATRFGISLQSALGIFEAAEEVAPLANEDQD